MNDRKAKKVYIPGLRLKECRKEKGLTQKELADKVFYQKEYINALENGRKNMSKEAAERCSEVLGVRKDYLLCKNNYKTSEEYFTAHKNMHAKINYLGEILYNSGFNCRMVLYSTNDFLTNEHCKIDGYLFNSPDKKPFYCSAEDISQTTEEIIDFIKFKFYLLAQRTDSLLTDELSEFCTYQGLTATNINFLPTLEDFEKFRKMKNIKK